MMIAKIRPWLKFLAVSIVLSWYLGQLLLISFLRGKSVERGFKYRRKFCKAALSILAIQYEQSGLPYTGACLYVSNHRSMLDPLIQLGSIDAFILSKAEVGRYPVLGRGAKETGVILVHRHDQGSRKSALEAIEDKLLSGYPVLIYPEGTTHGGEFTGDFRRGAIELAYLRGIPVVPVMIEYPDSSYYWTEGSLLGYFTNLFSLSGTHRVFGKVGNPVTHTSPDTLLEDIRACIDKMIAEVRANDIKQK
jgi:lyso-ornithine lipid O-acyltransferase